MRPCALFTVFVAGLAWLGCGGPDDPFTQCDDVEECVQKGHSCPSGQSLICSGARFGELGECACTPTGSGGPGGSGGGGTGGSGGMTATCGEPPQGAMLIGDQTFNDSDWEHAETHTDGATVTIEPTGMETSSGDPGPYRKMTHVIQNPDLSHPDCNQPPPDDAKCSFTLVVSHKYVAENRTYTPSTQGPIDHIDYSEGQIITDPAFEGAAVGWTFALWQNDTRYSLPGDAFRNVTWNTAYRCGLTADDFVPTEPPLDFESGGPITFGYTRSNTHTSPGGTQTNVHGIDNFQVVIVPQ